MSSSALVRLVFLFAFAALAAGCGGGLHSVSGKVTLDRTPLPSATVTFVPDEGKGNTSKALTAGKIVNGSYSLLTDGRSGAPAGWYKVVVLTSFPGAPDNAEPIDPRYASAATTPLSVQVPSPSGYDLEVARQLAVQN